MEHTLIHKREYFLAFEKQFVLERKKKNLAETIFNHTHDLL